jgi:PhnB protein
MPDDAYPQVTPYLLYEDCSAAIDYLCRAFGFREQLRYADDAGSVTHAELRLPGGGVIMLGDPGGEYRGPSRAGAVTVAIHVYVDDVDAHHRRAVEAGAHVLAAPEEQPYGDRRYAAEDPEGHQWFFAQHVRDVAPAEWGAVESAPRA